MYFESLFFFLWEFYDFSAFSFYRKMYGCEANAIFALKCIMRNSPFYLVSILLVGTIFVFGHALRICERFSTTTQTFGYYWNCMWLVILTMTTGLYLLFILENILPMFFKQWVMETFTLPQFWVVLSFLWCAYGVCVYFLSWWSPLPISCHWTPWRIKPWTWFCGYRNGKIWRKKQQRFWLWQQNSVFIWRGIVTKALTEKRKQRTSLAVSGKTWTTSKTPEGSPFL